MFLRSRIYKRILCSRLSFIFFIFVNFFLFVYYKKGSSCSKHFSSSVSAASSLSSEREWGRPYYLKILQENFVKKNDEWRLIRKNNFKHDLGILNCSALTKIDNLQFVASGWTKTTYKVERNSNTFSLKIVNVAGHDVSSCLSQNNGKLYDCFLMAATKLLHEITVLHSVSHPNIVKILGYCIQNELDVENPLNAVAIFEEYGQPVNVIKLLQLSWEDRLRICLGLTRLLKHFSSLPEPMALNDLRRQQFIVVDGEPKLVDIDDVGLNEPKCLKAPCCFNASSASEKQVCVPCIDGVCRGYNEKLNIVKIGNHFVKHILPHGAPPALSAMAQRITSAYELGSWNTVAIVKEMENLTSLFSAGKYRKSMSTFLSAFDEFKQKDVSSQFDYRCPLTMTGYGCIVSVVDADEAAEICLSEPDCKAFVLTSVFTWTGREVVHLKNGVGELVSSNTTTVFVKR